MVKLKSLLESTNSDNSPGPKGYAPFVTPEKFEQYKNYLRRIFETSGMRLVNEGVDDKGILKSIFLAGGPGSGKTWITRGLYGIPKKLSFSVGGLKLVNQDTELEMLLKKYFQTTDLDNMSEELFTDLTGVDFKGNKATSPTSGLRKYAKELTKARMEGYVRGRLGVIIDGTGHKFHAISKQKQKFEDLGYDSYMIFVNTTLEVALKRNLERDRVVPEKIVRESWQDVQ